MSLLTVDEYRDLPDEGLIDPIPYRDFTVYWDGLFWRLFDSYRGQDPKMVLQLFLKGVWQASSQIAQYNSDIKPGWGYLVTLFNLVPDFLTNNSAFEKTVVPTSFDVWDDPCIHNAQEMADFFGEFLLEREVRL